MRRVMKTRKKGKDMEIDGRKKMTKVTVCQVEVLLVLVLVVVAQGKKRRFEVEMVQIVARHTTTTMYIIQLFIRKLYHYKINCTIS